LVAANGQLVAVLHFVVDGLLWMAMWSYFLPSRYLPVYGSMPMSPGERASAPLSDNTVISVVLRYES
jgi:hypothetical protein